MGRRGGVNVLLFGTMYISFDPSPGRTVHSQLLEQLRLAIAGGEYPPGKRLPPTRVLASRLLLSPRTVARVYRQLAEEGLVEARQGRGTFVTRQALPEEQGAEVAGKRLEEAVALGLAMRVKPEVLREWFEEALKGTGQVKARVGTPWRRRKR